MSAPVPWSKAAALATVGAVIGVSAQQWRRAPEPSVPVVAVEGLMAVPAAGCEVERQALTEAAEWLEAEVLGLDQRRMALKVANDEAEGPVVPWPAELERAVSGLESEVHALSAEAGGELLSADCAELPCLFHLAFPADPSAEAWAATRARLTRGGWRAEGEPMLVLDPTIAVASLEDIETHVVVALWPPIGPAVNEATRRRVRGRRSAMEEGVGAD